MADGEGCKCNAHCEHECACDADWTTKEVYDLRADLAQRTADVAKAKAERDEARRSACMVKARYLGSIDGFPRPTDDEIGIKARAIARGIGWDCFKEEVRP
jgi:hypothetical protein